MHSFAVRLVADFRNLNGSTMIGRERRTLAFTTIIERVSASSPPSPWNFIAYCDCVATMPSKPVRKSTCQNARRISPSVTACIPAASCLFTPAVLARARRAARAGAPGCPHGRRETGVSASRSWLAPFLNRSLVSIIFRVHNSEASPMSARTRPPFPAAHVGSLLRPPELHEAREKAKKGEIDAAALHAVEDKCIREAVALQESVGLQGSTDGEFRRDFWHIDFLHGFDGVDIRHDIDGLQDTKFKGTHPKPPPMIVSARIRRTKPS